MNYSYENIFEKLVAEIPLKPSDNVYGITFIAGPGFGKSTVAKIISKKLGLYITVNDKIRRLYNELGFDDVAYEDDIKRMANDRTIYLLDNKTSHIIDANMEFYWEMALNNYNNHNAKLFFVELSCAEEEVLKRIGVRKDNFGKNDNLSRATEADYYNYLEKKKTNGIPKNKIFFTIHTDTSVEEIEKQVDILIEKIRSDI